MIKENLTGYPSIDKPWLKYYDEEFLKKSLPEMTLLDYLKANTLEMQDEIAISYYGKEISYKKLYENIDVASKILTSIGVKSGDRIMYLMPNIPETAYLLYGGSQIGAVADYVDPRPDSIDLTISAKKILSLIKEENCKYVVALEQCYMGMLKLIEKELLEMGINQIITVSAANSLDKQAKLNFIYEKLYLQGFKKTIQNLKMQKEFAQKVEEQKKISKIKILDYRELEKNCQEINIVAEKYVAGRLEIIVHTSGTSSAKPKPIPLSNDNLNTYVHQTFGANMAMECGDKALHMLPYFAAFGVVDVVHAGLCHGNNLIQIPEFAVENLGKLILRYKPQIIIGPPTWYLGLIKDKNLRNADLSFLKMITYGGDSMINADEERINSFLKSHNCENLITKGHGMSETCGCASFAIGTYNKLASVGIPMPNTIYAIVDSETKEMISFEEEKDFIEGELIISSKSVTDGILDGNPIVSKIKYGKEVYILTGDIARMDKDGIMYFLDRSNRSFTLFDGYKVKPHIIETIIEKNENVKYCAIIPCYDEKKMGNIIAAKIVLKENVGVNNSQQIDFVEGLINQCFVHNAEVSSRQIPSRIFFSSSLPVTLNGKIDYNTMKKQIINEKGISVELEGTNISVGKIIVKKE